MDAAPVVEPRRLRRVVLTVAGLNLGYFFVEVSVALAIGSVSLLADSVDFLEDTAINLLIALALGWPLRRRAVAGHAMALIILVPALVAAWQAVVKALDPVAPDVTALIVTAGGAAVVNAVSALLLVRVRHHAGSLSGAAYLSARNDVVINLAIIAMALVTAWTGSGWPDIVLGCVIALVSSRAAWRCGSWPVRSGSPPGRWPVTTSTDENTGERPRTTGVRGRPVGAASAHRSGIQAGAGTPFPVLSSQRVNCVPTRSRRHWPSSTVRWCAVRGSPASGRADDGPAVRPRRVRAHAAGATTRSRWRPVLRRPRP